VGVRGWGPYGPELVVEIGVSNGSDTGATWDVSAWDGSDDWGRDVVWTDISEFVREVQIDRGKNRTTEFFRYSVATMTMLLSNGDDRFSPVNLSGPYVVGGRSQIKPRIPIRVYSFFRNFSNNIIYVNWIFQGFVDSWQDQFPGQKDATTYIECTDMLSVLARFNGPELAGQGAGETLSARVVRIAENAGFTGVVSGSGGAVTLQATTLAGNALTEATLAADTENGAIYADALGRIVVKAADTLLSTLGGSVLYTFGGGGIPISDPQFAYDADLVYNRIAFARVGGTQQTAVDNVSIADLGADLGYSRNDLIAEDDADVAAVAELFLARFTNPEYRVAAATVYPQIDHSAVEFTVAGWFGSIWGQVLGADLLMPARVEVTTPGGLALNQVVYIDGISHSIRPGMWVTTFNFSSAEVFQAFGTSLWDEGLWDESKWLFG
jgi:hypothetical protein